MRAPILLAALSLQVLTASGDGILPQVPDAQAAPDEMLDELPEYIPSKGNLEARDWFRNAKFGMFIHWGVYSVLGRGEWVLHNDRLTLEQYRDLPPHFNPEKFNATEWVQVAKNAGMKYINFVSKHHDGFAMWHTKQTKWNVVDTAAYGKDILKQLSEACKAEGLKLFLYYSPLDWSHPDFFPRGWTGTFTGRPDSGVWQKYLDYMNRQIKELLTDYGEIAGIWLDGWWDKPSHETWKTEETYKLIHELRPDALIGNNHHRTPYWMEDMQIFEKDAPGENTQGYAHNSMRVEESLPLETCDTLHNNGAWGYTADHTPKPIEDVIRMLVRTAGFDANLLLNIGPPPDGQLLLEFQQTLELVGSWLDTYGYTIYGTRGGPNPPQNWGVTTQVEGAVYMHILYWFHEDYPMELRLPALPYEMVEKATVKTCGPPLCSPTPDDVKFSRGEDGAVVVTVSPDMRDEYDTIVELTVSKTAWKFKKSEL